MRKFYNLIFWFFVILTIFAIKDVSCQAQQKLSDNPEVRTFIQQMVMRYNFNANYLNRLFDRTTINRALICKMDHPYEDQPWYVYRKLFLQKRRVEDGVLYWHHHREVLRYAASHYGVPAHIIVAIIGVESLYGEIKPKYPILNSLLTLSFVYPRREAFFRSELAQYLLLAREMQLNPGDIDGSYAGAMGLPQFMPYNYRQFAVSYRHRGYPNLFKDTDDVVTSVGYFLQQKGWQRGQPIVVRARVIGPRYKQILMEHITEPQLTIAELRKYGIYPRTKIAKSRKAILIELRNTKGNEYWLGFNNFYVLSKYNRHKHYIMAVYQLAREINKIMRHKPW